jgi:hypothetical protein
MSDANKKQIAKFSEKDALLPNRYEGWFVYSLLGKSIT